MWALDRDRDVSGVSGPGRIAYALEAPDASGVLLAWDTEWVTIDWRPSMQVLEQIHGHNGATRITDVSGEPEARERALTLLRSVVGPASTTLTSIQGLVQK